MLIGKEDQPDKLNQNSTEIASFDLCATKLGQNSVFLQELAAALLLIKYSYWSISVEKSQLLPSYIDDLFPFFEYIPERYPEFALKLICHKHVQSCQNILEIQKQPLEVLYKKSLSHPGL